LLIDLSCKGDDIAGFIYHRWLKSAKDNDAYKDLRRDMANDLAEMLKPIPDKDRGTPHDRLQNYIKEEIDSPGFDISRREPDALWRYAYVRALVDLGVDTDGKGHFIHTTLEKLAETDVSEDVREAAKKASERLKRIRGGYADGSNRRHLMQAYWWFRWAHLKSLGIKMDEKEALKVRVTEYR